MHELRNVQQGGHHSALHEGFLGIAPYVLNRSVVVSDKQAVGRIVAPLGKPFLKALADNAACIDDGVLHVRIGGGPFRKRLHKIVRNAACADLLSADLAETGGKRLCGKLNRAHRRGVGHGLIVIYAVRLGVLP